MRIDRIFFVFCVTSTLPGTKGSDRPSNNCRFVEFLSNFMGRTVSISLTLLAKQGQLLLWHIHVGETNRCSIQLHGFYSLSVQVSNHDIPASSWCLRRDNCSQGNHDSDQNLKQK